MSGPGIEVGRLKRNKPKDYLIRFGFGGVVTALTGLIASHWGPVVGGLFLAFPAILPATLTLVASHDDKSTAGSDAAGAAVGALGLAAFAIVVWQTADATPAWLVLIAASAVWLAISIAAWLILRALGIFAGDDQQPEPKGQSRRSPDEPFVLAPAPRD